MPSHLPPFHFVTGNRNYGTVNVRVPRTLRIFRTESINLLSESNFQNYYNFINISIRIYRVSINSFPDYKHLLQENYVEYKHFF